MCGTNDLQLCYKEQHEETKDIAATTPSHSRSRSRSRNNINTSNNSNISSSSSSSVEKVRKETQQLMEDSEQLVRIMTHVCSQQFSGACKTLARYSQGCWRGCSAKENVEGRRSTSHRYDAHLPSHHPPSPPSPSFLPLHPFSVLHCSCCSSVPPLSSSFSSSSLSCQHMLGGCCKFCHTCSGCYCDNSSPSPSSCYSSWPTPPGCHHTYYHSSHQSLTPHYYHHLHKQQFSHCLEESPPSVSSSLSSPSSLSSSSSSSPSPSPWPCRCRGDRGRRSRRRWGRWCQCAQCHQGDGYCNSFEMGIESGGGEFMQEQEQKQKQKQEHEHGQEEEEQQQKQQSVLSVDSPANSPTTTASPTVSATTCGTPQDPTPLCPSAAAPWAREERLAGIADTPSCAHGSAPDNWRRTAAVSQPLSQAKAPGGATTTATASSPKARGGAPAHPSLLTILLLLVVTLARFTDGCSSRSTPKPRPASPTMRPNITFQTYACPPAYAAWYCLNGATCFTVKIGESILYNCECADGYMGQRCEFKDLDGTYLPQQERVLLETASIAGGATVACVLVFIVLFAVYIFMQKDKDKRCRDLDDGRDSYRQPFSGYQNPRPEVFRTISNPYARTVDELSHVEVDQSSGHGNLITGGRNDTISNSGGGRGNFLHDDSQHHSAQDHTSPPPTAAATS